MPAIQHWAAETTYWQKVQNATDTESSPDETGHQFLQWRTAQPVELFRARRVPRPCQNLFSTYRNLFAVAVRQEHYGECRLHRTDRDRHTSNKSSVTYFILFCQHSGRGSSLGQYIVQISLYLSGWQITGTWHPWPTVSLFSGTRYTPVFIN